MTDSVPVEVRMSELQWFITALGPTGWLIVLLGVALVGWGFVGLFVTSKIGRVFHLFASFVPAALGLAGLLIGWRGFGVLATATAVKPSEIADVISAGLAQGIAGSLATLASGLLAGVGFALNMPRTSRV